MHAVRIKVYCLVPYRYKHFQIWTCADAWNMSLFFLHTDTLLWQGRRKCSRGTRLTGHVASVSSPPTRPYTGSTWCSRYRYANDLFVRGVLSDFRTHSCFQYPVEGLRRTWGEGESKV